MGVQGLLATPVDSILILDHDRDLQEDILISRENSIVFAVLTALVLAAGGTAPAAAQAVPLSTEELPLAKDIGVKRGLTVTPAFEGWYENPNGDGYILSFGYYNRNSEEVLHVPVGPDNQVEGVPGGEDQGQPTVFMPERHWGVFGVKVPADFGDREAVWTVRIRNRTFEIPGSLDRDWKIDATTGDAMGNYPPAIRFSEDGPVGEGPGGITASPQSTRVGSPLGITVWARDDGTNTNMLGSGEADPVTLTWFKHQGPGEVTFSEKSAQIPNSGGQMTTQATFSAPGEYVLRVRATDDSGVVGAGHAQCCWTNGFIEVTVTN